MEDLSAFVFILSPDPMCNDPTLPSTTIHSTAFGSLPQSCQAVMDAEGCMGTHVPPDLLKSLAPFIFHHILGTSQVKCVVPFLFHKLCCEETKVDAEQVQNHAVCCVQSLLEELCLDSDYSCRQAHWHI